MGHVVLAGDSIFDNRAYIAQNEPDVVEQVRGHLPRGWRATLIAVDGSVLADVPRQLDALPEDTTHLIISAGGNDVLGHFDLLSARAHSMADALTRLAERGDAFERGYRRMLDAVARRGLPTGVCTIYYPAFPDPMIQRLAVTGLTIFNDAILRLAVGARVPVLDLRLICTEPADYANAIEPSAAGGEKIASVIATVLREHDFARRRATIYTA